MHSRARAWRTPLIRRETPTVIEAWGGRTVRVHARKERALTARQYARRLHLLTTPERGHRA